MQSVLEYIVIKYYNKQLSKLRKNYCRQHVILLFTFFKEAIYLHRSSSAV